MSMPEQLKPVTPDAPALGITHSASLAHTSLPPRSFRMAFTRPVLIRESHSKSLRTIEPQNITDRKSTRLNSSHLGISYAVFCLKKKTSNDPTLVMSRFAPLGRTPACTPITT